MSRARAAAAALLFALAFARPGVAAAGPAFQAALRHRLPCGAEDVLCAADLEGALRELRCDEAKGAGQGLNDWRGACHALRAGLEFGLRRFPRAGQELAAARAACAGACPERDRRLAPVEGLMRVRAEQEKQAGDIIRMGDVRTALAPPRTAPTNRLAARIAARIAARRAARELWALMPRLDAALDPVESGPPPRPAKPGRGPAATADPAAAAEACRDALGGSPYCALHEVVGQLEQGAAWEAEDLAAPPPAGPDGAPPG
jgi:hypothetical protein